MGAQQARHRQFTEGRVTWLVVSAAVLATLLLLARGLGLRSSVAGWRQDMQLLQFNDSLTQAGQPAQPRSMQHALADAWQQQQQQDSHVPPALERVLVVVCFWWNPKKLIYLREMLQTAAAYRSPQVDVLLVTNDAVPLRAVLATWEPWRAGNMSVWQQAAPAKPHPHRFAQSKERGEPVYWLTWAHKPAIEAALQQRPDHYTTVAYMEDDTHLTWQALVSWALDTELLARHNFTRCFFRTEVHATTGRHACSDYSHAVNLTDTPTVDAQQLDAAAYEALAARVAGKTCGAGYGLVDGGRPDEPCLVHRRFFSPPEPFQGMFVLTASQLAAYMAHPWWQLTPALEAPWVGNRIVNGRYVEWEYPERSNSINVMMHKREGFASSCLVPYELASDGRPQLSERARVHHMRNGYAGLRTIFGIDQAAALVT